MFSVEEISEQYWAGAGARDESCKAESKMNRSESEWAFQQFLQQEAAGAADSTCSSSSSTLVDVKHKKDIPFPAVPLDSEDYHTLLKTKLNLACAAVAMTRVCISFCSIYFLISLSFHLLLFFFLFCFLGSE